MTFRTPTPAQAVVLPTGHKLIQGEAYGQRFVSLIAPDSLIIVNAYEQGAPEMFAFLSPLAALVQPPEAPPADPRKDEPVATKGTTAIVDAWNALPNELRLSPHLCKLYEAVKTCRDVEAPAPQVPSEAARCMCKDRAATDCPGEWEPGCDLGNNAEHVRVSTTDPAVIDAAVAAPAARLVGGEAAEALRTELRSLGYSDTAINAMGASTTMMQRAVDAARALVRAQAAPTDAQGVGEAPKAVADDLRKLKFVYRVLGNFAHAPQSDRADAYTMVRELIESTWRSGHPTASTTVGLTEAARDVITARDNYGWSTEVDEKIEALRVRLDGGVEK